MENKIVVVAPVWAREEAEAIHLHSSLKALSRLGLPVLLADGGSPAPFLAELETLPGVTLVSPQSTPAPRLTGQIQRVFAAVREQDPEWVLYVEPDKEWFFTHRLAEFAAQTSRYPEAGIIVASRDAASFTTFPTYQHQVESRFNEIAAEWLGTGGGDLLYGPLLIRADLLEPLDTVAEDIGWGWRTFLFAVARRRALSLISWESYLPCPEDQRGEDDPTSRRYRLQQMGQNITGLALGLKTPLAV